MWKLVKKHRYIYFHGQIIIERKIIVNKIEKITSIASIINLKFKYYTNIYKFSFLKH